MSDALPEGWKTKYTIGKTDGTPVDPDAVYFVLRLDELDPYGEASKKAALAYANEIATRNPELAADLLARVLGLTGQENVALIVQAIGRIAGCEARRRMRGVQRMVKELSGDGDRQITDLDAMLSEVTDIARRIGPARQAASIRKELDALCHKWRYRRRSREAS